MLLRLQGRKAGEYMRFEKPGYMLGFFYWWAERPLPSCYTRPLVAGVTSVTSKRLKS